MNSQLRRVIITGIIGLGGVGVLFVLWLLWALFAAPGHSGVAVTIPDGSGVVAIADTLAEQDAVLSPLAFTMYVAVSGQSNNLQAGDYFFPAGSNATEVASQIADGRVDVREETVTLLEGWNRFQVQEELRSHSLDADGFVSVVTSSNAELSETLLDGKPEGSTLEGYLYPDTYNFFRDDTGEEMITKMIANFEAKMTPEIRAQVEESKFTFFEVLTLASIVEKEVSRAEDKPLVAAVFIERTNDGYLLQSDATLNYITGKSTIRPNADDLAQESLYNTYKYPGLPPGPIANPSIESITAVLNPEETDAYFFIATPDGDTLYSVTYEEHLQKRYDIYGY